MQIMVSKLEAVPKDHSVLRKFSADRCRELIGALTVLRDACAQEGQLEAARQADAALAFATEASSCLED